MEKLVFTQNGGTLNLRTAPHGNVIDKIPNNATVEVLSEENEWSKITYKGKEGYVMSSFLTSPDSNLLKIYNSLKTTLALIEEELQRG